MMRSKLFREVLTAGGFALCIFPIPNPIAAVVSPALPRLFAQRFPDRMRRPLMPPGVQPPGGPLGQHPVPTATQTQPAQPAIPTLPAVASPNLPPSLLNQPAKPAEVRLDVATLTIQADNSSLNQILKSISSQSGMTFQGLASDERVFGSFGPGAPRDVLAALLNGTPYNILMVGDLRDGAPRQLILSPARSSGDSSAAGAAPVSLPSPPADADAASAGDDDPNPDQPQSPQELYQQLQKMREAQQHPQR